MKWNKQRILFLALCFVVGFTVACAKKPRQQALLPPPPEVTVLGDKVFINTLELPAGPYARFALPKLTQLVHEKFELNSDTVAWIKVPNTTIDDAVVWYPDDTNLFYLRRNFDKRSDFNGTLFADFRCEFDGTGAGLAPNTVIYGHSMSDDPLDYRKQFSPLKLFKDIEFAKQTPYIYFSTADEDLIFEVFTVMYTSTGLYYNTPDPKDDFDSIIAECRKRSIYNYNVDVKKEDKILTLSTCTYSLPDGRTFPVSEAENGFRYVIMAKLVTDKANLKNAADLAVNPEPAAP